MPWVTMGSREDIARKERSALNAYMFWTKTDCKTMTMAEALSKFGRELWWDENASFSTWCKNYILTQDVDGLEAMRSEYTKMSGEDWKTASLGHVMKTLGFCRDLYKRAAILIDGIPNTRVELLNRGIDVSKGSAKKVVETIESSSWNRISYKEPMTRAEFDAAVEKEKRLLRECVKKFDIEKK